MEKFQKLIVKNLVVKFNERPLLKPLSFELCGGEVLVLIGESGIGKSTILNWMIGALNPDFSAEGTLWLGDNRLDLIPIEKRNIGILFQDDLLFPHLSVGGNLAFALPIALDGKKLSALERKEIINQNLELAGLPDFYNRDVATLSGGQKARVSVLRALLAKPKVLLLDEPFSKLDKQRREQFRNFVFSEISRQKIPSVLVTHDSGDIPAQAQILRLDEYQI